MSKHDNLQLVAVSDVRAELENIERRRLKALVDADVAAAEELHADDFQLVTPSGAAYTKDEYLGVSPRELSTTASGNRTRLTYVSAETRAVSDTTQS